MLRLVTKIGLVALSCLMVVSSVGFVVAGMTHNITAPEPNVEPNLDACGVWPDFRTSEDVVFNADANQRLVGDANSTVYYLPEGDSPNDWTFRSRDCNKPLTVIDANGTVFFVTPLPFGSPEPNLVFDHNASEPNIVIMPESCWQCTSYPNTGCSVHDIVPDPNIEFNYVDFAHRYPPDWITKPFCAISPPKPYLYKEPNDDYICSKHGRMIIFVKLDDTLYCNFCYAEVLKIIANQHITGIKE